MKYLLDKNTISNELMKRAKVRKDVCIIKDVEDEYTAYDKPVTAIRGAGVEVLDIAPKHLEKLKELMVNECENFDLIRLYTCEGTADVMMLAFALSEMEKPSSLFSGDYTIVTQDSSLMRAAVKYGVPCEKTLP